MEQRLRRLDILLTLIAGSDMPTAQALLPSFVQADFGIADREALDTELEMLLAILMEDDHIIEDEESNRSYYQATQSGIEFIHSGGYTADKKAQDVLALEKDKRDTESYQYTRKQSDNYLSQIHIQATTNHGPH